MLGSELAAGEQVRVIAGENVARVKAELSITEIDRAEPEMLKRLGGRLGAPLLVLGSYVVLQGDTDRQIRLDLRLLDAASGEAIALVSETGWEGQLFDLVSRSGTLLREKLGMQGPSNTDAEQVRAAFPSRPEAAKLYAEGLSRLRGLHVSGARELLEAAVAADPEYPLAHAALAQALSTLGYVERARREARRALDLSGGLARAERLLIEGRYHELCGETDLAIDIYAALVRFFPDNLDFGLDLARVQAIAGKRDALDTLEELRRLPPPFCDDPRIDLEEARAAGTLALLDRMRDAAARAVAKGRALGARYVVARPATERASRSGTLDGPRRRWPPSRRRSACSRKPAIRWDQPWRCTTLRGCCWIKDAWPRRARCWKRRWRPTAPWATPKVRPICCRILERLSSAKGTSQAPSDCLKRR